MNCPKCSAPLQDIHLDQDITIENCTHCSGAFYDDEELSLKLDLGNRLRSALLCPQCGEKMDAGTLYNGELTVEQCAGCSGFWLDSGEIGKLRRLSGREDILATPGQPREPILPFPAQPAPTQDPPGIPAPITEFDTRPIIPKDSGEETSLDQFTRPRYQHEGRSYEHFQTSWPKVTNVLGEFNWKVAAGEQVQSRDFIHPPYLLSQEISGKESNWTHGEYIEPAEIWEAFGLAGSPPEKQGVAPAQPNPQMDSWLAIKPLAWLFVGACAVFFMLQSALAARKVVFDSGFHFNTNDPAARAFVSLPFEIKGDAANLKVELNTSMDNNWVYFNMALVDETAGKTINFGTEISHYSGIDDGERWSEGNQNATLYLPSVPPGRYILRMEPEASSTLFSGQVKLTHDVPQLSHLYTAVALLLAPLLWAWFRHAAFEHKRWLESDHPWFETVSEEFDQ